MATNAPPPGGSKHLERANARVTRTTAAHSEGRQPWLIKQLFMVSGLILIVSSLSIALLVDGWPCGASCRAHEPLIFAAAYTSHKPVEMRFTYTELDGPTLRILPTSSALPNYLLLSANVGACKDGSSRALAGSTTNKKLWEYLAYFSESASNEIKNHYDLSPSMTRYDVSGLSQKDAYPITCAVAVEPAHVSFESRKLSFLHWISGSVGSDLQSDYNDFELGQPPEADNVRINDYGNRFMVRMPTPSTYLSCPDGRTPCDVKHAALPIPAAIAEQDGIVTFEWSDVRAGQWHELLFFVVGGLFAFGLVCVLEHGRPLFNKLRGVHLEL